jgi:uncharacterized protein YegL
MLNQDNNTSILPSCPITGQHMKDPVTTPDGNTYEKEAIEKWLENHNTEPQTRSILRINQLIPNRVLKEMYDKMYGLNQTTIVQTVNIEQLLDLKLEMKSNKIKDDTFNILITITCPETFNESYHDIVLCIDTSSSMDASADKQGNEVSGLSVLDILKYSANVIIKSGNEKQRIGIVQFSNEGRIVKPLTVLNEFGKRDLSASIELLNPNGQTNLYDGIIKSWDLFESSTCNKKSIILFTDGEPNMEPPRGYINQLQNIKEKKYNGKYISDINIYTYGNSVNSELSDNISKETNGVYGFIPDSTLMGDLLTHKIAALRSTKTKNAVLKLEFGSNILDSYISSSISHEYISNNLLIINVGDILDESSRNFVLEIKTTDSNPPNIYTVLECEDKKIEQTIINNTEDLSDIIYNSLRQESVTIISNIIKYASLNNSANADILFNDFILKLSDSDLRIVNLKETFDNQVKLAYSYKYYNKWGKHYLLSLKRALQLEQCNNYKDKCVQHFGGTMFKKLLDEADDIFTRLPPPKASRKVNRSSQSSQSMVPINMNNYVSRNNTCFHGLSKVLMHNYTLKNANEVRKGDYVKLANGKKCIIECVVKTVLNSEINMITLNDNLHLTPYHPVKINNEWYFPKDLNYAKLCELPCHEIFSFILKKDNNENTRGYNSGIMIGDHECATLGHGITGNIIEHPFFGTELVINNLKELYMYELGMIVLQQDSLIRNQTTDLVERIVI